MVRPHTPCHRALDLSRRLKKSLNAVQRLKARAYAEQARTGPEEKRFASGPRSEGAVTGPGEYRTYFVSETCLETEEDCFARYNATSLPQLLHIGSDIPESYGRLSSSLLSMPV